MLHSNSALRVVRWSENTFLSSEENWQKLLTNSDMDQFFLSWHWLTSWWNNWGNQSIDSLFILAAYEGERLVGIAPLYLTEAHYLRGVVKGKKLQFLGSRADGHAGILTEYLDFICESSRCHEIFQVLLSEINSCPDWSEFVLSHIKTSSFLCGLIKNQRYLLRTKIRILETKNAYSINSNGNYQEYLDKLGKHTRLRLYNRRKLLVSLGDIQLEKIHLTEDSEIFNVHNMFAYKRWSHHGITKADIKAFISGIKESSADVNKKSFSSILKVNGVPVSAIINVFCNNKIYNIQLGYEEKFHKKISLGTLHLGYAIEQAFDSDIVEEFDLLAGEGKNTDYKKSIAEYCSTLETVQVIRHPLIKFLYFINDYIVKPFYRKIGYIAKEN